jgi:uncharacterized protein (DUF1330 family)
MTAVYRMVLVAACDVVVGVFAMGVLHGQAPPAPPPAYLISNAEAITDTAMLARYGAAVGKTIAAFDGQVIAAGSAVGLDSSPPPKGAFVLIRFPSMKALQDWWNSPAYSAIRPLREKSTIGRMYVLQGLPAR